MKTPTLLPLLRLSGALALCATFAACTGTANSAPVPAATPAAAPFAKSNMLQQIQAEVGDAACDSAQQCKTVAIGHKACGGPESYMAWSNKRSDGTKITQLAAALAAESKAQTINNGMMSTCSMVVDPGATCSAGHCVTQGPGGAVAR